MRKSTDLWLAGQAVLASQCNIDIKLIKSAMKHPAFKGLFKSNGKCNATKIPPLIEQYREELENSQTNELAYWKTIKTEYDAKASKLNFEELEKQYVKREEVLQMITSATLAQKNILNIKLLEELPHNLVGLTVPEIIEKLKPVVIEICDVMENIKL